MSTQKEQSNEHREAINHGLYLRETENRGLLTGRWSFSWPSCTCGRSVPATGWFLSDGAEDSLCKPACASQSFQTSVTTDESWCKNLQEHEDTTWGHQSHSLVTLSLSSLFSVCTLTVSHQVPAGHLLRSLLLHPCFKRHAAVLGRCLQVVLQLSQSTQLQVRKRIKKK